MKTYILINVNNPTNPILGVYDSELLALKRLAYFKSIYFVNDLKIAEKEMEYIDRE